MKTDNTFESTQFESIAPTALDGATGGVVQKVVPAAKKAASVVRNNSDQLFQYAREFKAQYPKASASEIWNWANGKLGSILY